MRGAGILAGACLAAWPVSAQGPEPETGLPPVSARCAGGQALTTGEEFAFGLLSDSYILFHVVEGAPRQLTLGITTPGVLAGDGDVAGFCGAEIDLAGPDGRSRRGVATYRMPEPGADPRPYDFTVRDMVSGKPVMYFNVGVDDVISGQILGETGLLVFVGAARNRLVRDPARPEPATAR